MGRGGFPPSNLRTFSSFKNPNFRLYFFGMSGMMAAQNILLIGRSLLAYRLTRSAAFLGGVAVAYTAPIFFVSLFGGVIADRVQKKYVILVGLAGSALVVLGLALSLTLGYLSAERTGSWWILIVAVALLGAISGLIMPARQSILPEIVGKEGLLNAVSLNSVGTNALRLIVPVATGFIIDAIGFAAIYYIMTGLYLVAVVLIAFLPRTTSITIRVQGALTDIIEGFQYLRRETILIIILLFVIVIFLLSFPYMMMLPIFTEDILNVGATGLGVLMSVSGVGAIASSLTLASLPNRKRGAMLLASSLILGVALVGFSFSSSWPLSLGIIIIVGLGQSGRMALANTLLQYYSDDEHRGRVMSIFNLDIGLSAITTFAAGLMAETVGVQWAIGGFATVLIFLTILTLVFVPRLSRLD